MSSLGVDLKFQRLAHRADRIEQVLAALHERRSEHALEAVPPPLDLAIHDFSGQLTQMRAHLAGRALGRGPAVRLARPLI